MAMRVVIGPGSIAREPSEVLHLWTGRTLTAAIVCLQSGHAAGQE